MAIRQNKPARSKRGMRRPHGTLIAVTGLPVDKTSDEEHLRHHVVADSYYCGHRVIAK